MARCHLCNDFEIGKGDELPSHIWVAHILSSQCRYCQTLVKALNTLKSGILSEDYRNYQLKQTEVNFRIELCCPGEIWIFAFNNGRSWMELRLHFFQSVHTNSPARAIDTFHFPLRGEIAPVPGDPAMWRFLRSSLRTCLEEHSECMNAQDSMWCPERLLSLQIDGKGERTLRLIETRLQRPRSAYIALSHCWGSEQLLRTTSDTLQSHQNMIDSSKLPRTFHDTVTVAQELGVSHIWIDSLCIIQDQEDDWAHHAEQMDKIYESALFVVAAASSSGGSVPFLGSDAPTNRHTRSAVDVDFSAKEDACVDGSTVVIKARKVDGRIGPSWAESPLDARAWAFQESYFAVRLMSFTQDEARWQCKVAIDCESDGALDTREAHDWQHPEPDDMDDGGAVILQKWRDIVGEYASRQLSYNTDRLPAIAGVASRFHSLLQSSYVAGLWQVELPFNLGWFRRELIDCPTDTPLIPSCMDNGVPTWSWASNYETSYWLWAYRIYFATSSVPENEPPIQLRSKVDMIRIECVPSVATNAFGAVETGSFIELRGRLVRAVMQSDAYGCASVQRDGFNPQLVIPDCRLTCVMNPVGTEKYGFMRRDSSDSPTQLNGSKTERNPARISGYVFCLLLYSGTFRGESKACILILGQISDGDTTSYQRLGLGGGKFENWSGPLYAGRKDWAPWQGWEELEQWEEWERWFTDAELHTVRIV